MAALVCPLCITTDGRTVRTQVRDTRRNAPANVVVRLRRCPECGASVKTVEQAVAVRAAGMAVPQLVMSSAGGC